MNVLVVDELHKVFYDTMKQAKFRCTNAVKWTDKKIFSELFKYQGLVIRSRFKCDKAFIKENAHLKFIARPGSGLENIDVKEAAKNEIEVIRSPQGNANAVGEHALGMLLNAIRNINRANTEVKKLQWNRKANLGFELEGKTLGIIGYGNTGSRFAEKLAGFNVQVLTYDKYKDLELLPNHIEQCKMNRLYKECDVLSLHIPYNKETHYLVNDTYLKRFKKPIILINTSRGAIVNTKDLFKHIKSKRVSFACLDVLEHETQDLSSLQSKKKVWLKTFLNHPSVLVTPHIAGVTKEALYKISKYLADNIAEEFVV